MPDEVASLERALQLADKRMYTRKSYARLHRPRGADAPLAPEIVRALARSVDEPGGRFGAEMAAVQTQIAATVEV